MSPLRVAFRADASIAIGSGHVMRCLTLADSVRTQGAEVTFISRDLPGNLIELVESKGYKVRRLFKPPKLNPMGDSYNDWLGVPWEMDVENVVECLADLPRQDWLVVDNYALDWQWEKVAKASVGEIMVIDDLANRNHDCKLLLDQNLYPNMSQRYNGLIPANCMIFLGPRYALLRTEFEEQRQKIRARNGQIRRILIFFGGSDGTNETEKTLTAIELAGLKDLYIDVVVGSANPHRRSIQERCSRFRNHHFHFQVSNMAELMAAADLAIGAGGATTWERCTLGLPSLVTVIAENQLETTNTLASTGSIMYLGKNNNIKAESIASALAYLAANPAAVKEMAEKALAVMSLGISNSTASLIDAIWGKAYAS